jgi:hypothetical protein
MLATPMFNQRLTLEVGRAGRPPFATLIGPAPFAPPMCLSHWRPQTLPQALAKGSSAILASALGFNTNFAPVLDLALEAFAHSDEFTSLFLSSEPKTGHPLYARDRI